MAPVGTAHNVAAGILRTCSTLVTWDMLVRVLYLAGLLGRPTRAGGVLEVVAVDLAVVVAVHTGAAGADDTSLSGRAGQVALASKAAVGVSGVGVATSQVADVDLAVVVAVKRVAGAGGVVGKTTLPHTSVAVVVGGSIVVAVAGVLVAVGTSLVGKTSSSSDTACTADVLGDTLEFVVALLAAGESTALGLELLHGHGWESSSLMVGSLVMVDLMDGDSSVDHVGLDRLLLDNGLDSLMDVLDDVSLGRLLG
jgi:hypothetical protein